MCVLNWWDHSYIPRLKDGCCFPLSVGSHSLGTGSCVTFHGVTISWRALQYSIFQCSVLHLTGAGTGNTQGCAPAACSLCFLAESTSPFPAAGWVAPAIPRQEWGTGWLVCFVSLPFLGCGFCHLIHLFCHVTCWWVRKDFCSVRPG